MFELNSYKFTKENIITSNNFARNSDVVYSEYLPDEDYNKIKNKNTYAIPGSLFSTNRITFYKSIKFDLRENDIVFCNSLFVKPLFEHLYKVKEFKNIKLITNQTDIPVDKNLFSLKPDCISKWYSTNVEYDHNDLIPIPLGISGSKNLKNLTYSDYERLKLQQNKDEIIFSSFNINTNYFHRYNALKGVFNKDFSSIKKANLPIEEYLNYLNKHKFCLAPWGNGIDTHRLWEALYAGATPITKNHLTYKTCSNLPVILLDSYKEIDYKSLSTYEFKNINLQKLNIEWWINKIKEKEVAGNDTVLTFTEDLTLNQNNITKHFEEIHKTNRRKNLFTFLRKVHKKLVGKEINDYVSF